MRSRRLLKSNDNSVFYQKSSFCVSQWVSIVSRSHNQEKWHAKICGWFGIVPHDSKLHS